MNETLRFLLATFLLASCSTLADEADFNGRWDITIPGDATRAWWLEVTGAETDSPHVRFVSAYGGDLNVTDEVSVEPSQLTFGFRYERLIEETNERVPVHIVHTAHLDGEKLVGSALTEGSNRPPVEWVGVRAPQITDRDDGSWREGEPIQLFNGQNLDGWQPLEPNRQFGWTASNGILRAPGGGANLVSTGKFWNFKLHIEYRINQGSNSGIGLRGRYEVQILDDYGSSPNSHGNGSIYSRIAPSVNADRPAGEWQTYDITLIGRDVTVVLNGTTIIDKQVIEGLTAMGHDPNEGEPGPISLQGDHGPVEFRNIVLTPLTQ